MSRYDVEFAASGELRAVGRPRLFATSQVLPQPRLFALESLGETGWIRALRLRDYAPRKPRRPEALQQALFPYRGAWG